MDYKNVWKWKIGSNAIEQVDWDSCTILHGVDMEINYESVCFCVIKVWIWDGMNRYHSKKHWN